jgi:predicted HTH transcriptional regulator
MVANFVTDIEIPISQEVLRLIAEIDEFKAREHGRVTTQGIEQATGESRSTIKARLKQLTDDRLLVRYGQGRSTWYGLA